MSEGGGATSDRRARAARLPSIDAARGLALVAMVVFHGCWDLAHFGWIDADFVLSRGFHAFGHAIAASFLALVGVSLVLADRARGPLWRDRRYFLRWLEIVAAAGAISAASYWQFPESPIFFGILHCIALSSLLALPLLRLPPAFSAGAGALALLAPLLVSSPRFDAPALWWTGLGAFEPASNDYRPLLPWFGVVLLGVAVARSLSERLARHDGGDALRPLAFLGRHSLAFYLIHQPILFGGFLLLGLVIQPAPDEKLFVAQCARQCVDDGQPDDLCEASCACVVKKAKTAELWLKLARDRLSPEDKTVIHDAAIACYAEAQGK